MKYNVDYRIETVTTNGQVKPGGCNSIEFIKKGDEDIVITNAIELDSDTPTFEFINRPGEVITTNFRVAFAGTGSDPKLIVIKTYYRPVE